MDDAILKLLVCPITKSALRRASDEEFQKLQARDGIQKAHGPGGRPDGFLIRVDEKLAYPVYGGIPIMLPDAAIAL